jgi:hypothetical protein
VVGLDRELMPNLAVQVTYSYGRTTDHIQEPWRGVGPTDYEPLAPATGTLPGTGQAYSIPVFRPIPAAVTAGGSGRFLTNYPDFYTTFNGVEFTVVKRLSNRWMMRWAGSYNNPREFYGTLVNYNGNPTRTDTSPLVQGGQTAPRSAGSGQGDVFMNAKWQMNINGVYQLPWEMEVAGNLFTRQGTAFPYEQRVALGLDGSQRVLVSPEVDTFRFPSLTNLDLRWAKYLRGNRVNSTITVDLFNLTNTNVEINRIRTVGSPAFGRITDNISPRILRFGVRLGF